MTKLDTLIKVAIGPPVTRLPKITKNFTSGGILPLSGGAAPNQTTLSSSTSYRNTLRGAYENKFGQKPVTSSAEYFGNGKTNQMSNKTIETTLNLPHKSKAIR